MCAKILDVTCGARTIWFDKQHPAAIYCDKRREEYHKLWKNAGNCSLNIDPDILCDFTALPFPDNSFSLVVFDPPHLTGAKETAWLVKKYGKLDDTWPKMLHDGFRECMRVLKPDGVLIFKWSEYDITADKVVIARSCARLLIASPPMRAPAGAGPRITKTALSGSSEGVWTCRPREIPRPPQPAGRF